MEGGQAHDTKLYIACSNILQLVTNRATAEYTNSETKRMTQKVSPFSELSELKPKWRLINSSMITVMVLVFSDNLRATTASHG
jgi:hypothetical protein